jgi:hypothetical protein
VLDGKDAIVTSLAQALSETAPPRGVMASAKCDI